MKLKLGQLESILFFDYFANLFIFVENMFSFYF